MELIFDDQAVADLEASSIGFHRIVQTPPGR
jgi:hypothetical protein